MAFDNKIIWTEGMFLRAQHFQQFDRYVDKLVRGRAEGMRGFSWGVSEIQLNRELLATGKFAVTACRGVLEDGTPFSIPDGADHPPPLELPDNTRNCLVYLMLPDRQPGAVEVTNGDRAELAARYAASEMEVIDTVA